MVKKTKDLSISFEIIQSDIYSRSSQPFLKFVKSNYALNDDEILRAKLRPNKFTLDNKVEYLKIEENAYRNREGENMLLLLYNKI